MVTSLSLDRRWIERQPKILLFLSAKYFPLLFLVGLLFGFRIGLDRIAMRADELFSFFRDFLGSLAQIAAR